MFNAPRTALLAIAALALGTQLLADDSDIFLLDAVEPNVVILVDSSGSMGNSVNGERKMDSAQRVVNSLIDNVQGIRLGVFRFNGNSDGGLIVAPIGVDNEEMKKRVNSMVPTGMTPLGRATQDLQDYYSGLYSGSLCQGYCEGFYPGGGQEAPPPSDDDDEDGDDDDEAPDEPEWTEVANLTSPIEYECQKNYAILITDGMPNGEAEDLVADVATGLFTTDHSPLPGVQNVVVHTIGFDVPAGTDLLTRTAANGGGNFYTAGNADQLEQALQDALSQILADAYSFSLPLIPSTSAAGGTRAYLASFRPEPVTPFWRGYLKAYDRAADGGIPLGADGEPDPSALAWDAGSLLAARAPAGRTIYTATGSTRQPFLKSTGALTPAMFGVTRAAEKDQIIDFIRGIDSFDLDADGNATEEREWKLGDIFHSDPVLVFPPPLHSSDEDYAAFKAANQNRPAIVLAGANDGMLHAFRATDGVELWGFVPPDLLGKLKELTGRIAAHPYYVDSSPVVADVKTGGTWKTIVVFGERRGGRSYHALDITDTTDPGYLWSFTDTEMGETWSVPAIGKVRLADGTDRWVAFVGGGYDTANNNASGRGVFVIDLNDGTKLWDYEVGTVDDRAQMNFSIPATPRIADLDGDGYVDRAYVGDVGGQLWKFDLSPPATLSGGQVNNWTGKRLFAAAPGQSNPPPAGEYQAPQAMYGTPALAYDATGHLWAFAGTGDRNHPKASASNAFFAIKDDTTMANGSALTPASLVDATSGDPVTQGWYYPLSSNEKVLSNADVFNNMVLFSSYLPDLTDICTAGLGSSRLYAVRIGDGLPAMDWTTGEQLPSPDGTEPASIDGGGGIPSAPEVLLGSGTVDSIMVGATDGVLTEVKIPASRTKRVRYWREVF